jgi:hypothetical protein
VGRTRGAEKERTVTLSDERLAKNEILFRAVNERLDDIGDAVPWKSETEYLCECSDSSCIETISLEKEEYEQARSRPTVFFVVPGHERSAIETIVEGHEHYLVEKIVALDAVKETDPRADGPGA